MKVDAVVCRTVADVRVEPDQRSELLSQVILGHGLEILERGEKWLLCRLDDGSEGWIHRGFLAFDLEIAQQYQTSDVFTVRALHTLCLDEPNPDAVGKVILTDGSRVLAAERGGEWTRAILPDGEGGWIQSIHLTPLEELPEATPDNIEARALEYLGIPYLWGGTSTLALDCSGLTQLVYRLHGIILPRNSSNQAQEGTEVDPGRNWENLRCGDLLFFAEGSKVDHVAISLRGPEIVHSSMGNGCVARESLNPDSRMYNPRIVELFRFARRLCQVPEEI